MRIIEKLIVDKISFCINSGPATGLKFIVKKNEGGKMATLKDYFSDYEILELAKDMSDSQKETVIDVFDNEYSSEDEIEETVQYLKKQLRKKVQFKDEEIHDLLAQYLKKFPADAKAALRRLLSFCSGYGYSYNLKKSDEWPSLNVFPFYSGDVKKSEEEEIDFDDDDKWPSLG